MKLEDVEWTPLNVLKLGFLAPGLLVGVVVIFVVTAARYEDGWSDEDMQRLIEIMLALVEPISFVWFAGLFLWGYLTW